MQKQKSIYIILGIIIVTTVMIIMSINFIFSYTHTKNSIIENMENNSRTTILSLKDNITGLLASYSINEYNKIIFNEIEKRDIYAIVIQDYNMGKIMGKESYISGKIKDSNSNIIDYDPLSEIQKENLRKSYFQESYNINIDNKLIGTISIYISNKMMNKKLNSIIFENLRNTIILSFLIILVLFFFIRLFILKPIFNIIEIVNNCDENGIPINEIPFDSYAKEIDLLSNTLNNMIFSIKLSRNILEKSENKLFEALEVQTTIFDNSGYIIIRTDKDGIIQQINKEATKLLGYESSDLVGIHTPEIIHLENEIKHRTKELSEEFGINLKPEFKTIIAKLDSSKLNDLEWTYVTKDKKHIPVLLSISALKDKYNNIYGYLYVAKNISQRKVIESQAKLASMGEMIGNIAHQWRQPLNVISTIASGIKIKSEYNQIDVPEILPDMTTIIKQTQYLSDTIDDFRDFIKNSNNKEKIILKEAIQKTLSITYSSMKSNNINIITDIENDTFIEGFKNQLIQAFINILNNAKDALNEQEILDKFIFISTKKIDDNLVLIIKDNAKGIDENIMPKIFEPYFTTKHKSIGTGIGLSLVHQIITTHHNATIDVSNEQFIYNENVYIGACFKITFRI